MTQPAEMVLPADVPAAFIYRRVSSLRQSSSGLGEDAQLAMCQEYFERRLKPAGYMFGGDFLDSAISARKRHFLKRPAADRLNITARRGDVVIVAKIDRVWRSLIDFGRTIENWEKRGIGLAVVANGIETWDGNSRANNKLLMAILAAVAEWESDMISTRTREAFAARRARGERCNQIVPPGSSRWGRRLIDCPKERPICQVIVAMRDRGYSEEQIRVHLRKHGMKRRDGREWSRHMIRSADRHERQKQVTEAAKAESDAAIKAARDRELIARGQVLISDEPAPF